MWALGISVIEMAEVVPPRWAVHPMRVIFQISREAPPRLADHAKWSPALHDFVARCLQKVVLSVLSLVGNTQITAPSGPPPCPTSSPAACRR